MTPPPVVLQKSDLSWTSTVIHFSQAAEHRLRFLHIAEGVSMLSQFPEQQARWWAVPLQESQLAAVRQVGHELGVFTGPLRLVKALGLEARQTRFLESGTNTIANRDVGSKHHVAYFDPQS